MRFILLAAKWRRAQAKLARAEGRQRNRRVEILIPQAGQVPAGR